MNHLNPAQVEQLKEIGAHLRQRRQELSIPIEEVASETYIRLPLLKALEEGQSDQLPEPVFVQGFIRRYGDVVGLDGAALAKTFPTNFLAVESNIYSQFLPTPRSRSIPLYVPCMLLVVTTASGLFYLLNRPQTTDPVVQKQNSPAQQQKTIASPVPSVPAAPKTARSTPTASVPSVPIQVTANLKEQSWLRVIVDGKTQFEGILTKGKRQTWTAKKQLTLRLGNAGGVLISFNRGKPKLLGVRGEVKEVTFTN